MYVHQKNISQHAGRYVIDRCCPLVIDETNQTPDFLTQRTPPIYWSHLTIDVPESPRLYCHANRCAFSDGPGLREKCGGCICVVFICCIYIYMLHCKITCKMISSLFSRHDLNLFFELWSKFTDSACIVCTYEVTRHWKKFESTYPKPKRIKGIVKTRMNG